MEKQIWEDGDFHAFHTFLLCTKRIKIYFPAPQESKSKHAETSYKPQRQQAAITESLYYQLIALIGS